ncbi:hypothetical protein [Flavobacterium limnosediminis]|uniref:hypothetical protein n=1 Tax=Flavobacterium limnosediminis TaxID=1401027 RepID=UPI0005569F19|nr:hypothetical protein [Flavobacterium limnosediminis]
MEIARIIGNCSYFDKNADFRLLTKRPFVYPLFLSILSDLKPFAIIFIQSLFGILNTFILFKTVKKIAGPIKKEALMLFIFTPSIFIYTHLLMSEWLIMLFLNLLAWLLIQKWSKTNFAYIQLLTLLLAFTKPVFYPFIYVNFLFFGIYMIRKRVFSFWLFLPILCLQGYLNYNETRTGYKHFSSIENINLINYNLYYFKSSTQSKEKADTWLSSIYNSDKYENKSFGEQNDYLKEVATTEIKNNFLSYSLYHFFTAVRGIFDPGRFDLMTYFEKEDGKQGFLEILNGQKTLFSLFRNKYLLIYLLLIPIFIVNALKWFYFSKFIIKSKTYTKHFYLILLLFYYILVTGPVNCSRYMMPFQGLLFVFALAGFYGSTKAKNKKLD